MPGVNISILSTGKKPLSKPGFESGFLQQTRAVDLDEDLSPGTTSMPACGKSFLLKRDYEWSLNRARSVPTAANGNAIACGILSSFSESAFRQPPTADGSAPDMNEQDLITRIRVHLYERRKPAFYRSPRYTALMGTPPAAQRPCPSAIPRAFTPVPGSTLHPPCRWGSSAKRKCWISGMDEPRPVDEIKVKERFCCLRPLPDWKSSQTSRNDCQHER